MHEIENKLGERSATRFRLCKSMFVGVYLDDVVALVALPWGVFTVSVGKEVLPHTHQWFVRSWLINLLKIWIILILK